METLSVWRKMATQKERQLQGANSQTINASWTSETDETKNG